MTLDKRIFVIEESLHTPIENLAINQLCVDLIKKKSYELIVRIYQHTNGLILGNNESILDVNIKNCKKKNYEVARRVSGGSVIMTNPDSTLCYSLFFDTNLISKKTDLNKIYKLITIPLAEKLGKNFSVEGLYYLRYRNKKNNFPVAGHAMKLYIKNILQFDGIVHLKSLDMDILSNLIKLRKLYALNDINYIKMEDKVYNIQGKEVKIDLKNAKLVKDEYEELKNFLGLEEIGINKYKFIEVLYNSVQEIFGDLEKVNSLNLDLEKLIEYKNEIKANLNEGKKCCLGHCFVDLLEPEPKIHYRQ